MANGDTDGLGAFLRSRRDRLGPEDVGLPVHGRRRTRGLRREEVAALAGVSVDYYTRLEQGRDLHPSPAIVRCLADALSLGPDERSHLHFLAGIAEARTYETSPELRRSVTGLLDTLMPAPAYVVTPVGDLVAWNDATTVLWIDPGSLPATERNLARMTLLDPRMRELWVDWEVVAREAVAHLRGARARFPDVVRVQEVLDDLREHSEEFRQWWAEHDVETPRAPRKRFAHPTHGELAFYNESMELAGESLLFMVYVPADDRTREACVALAAPLGERMGGSVGGAGGRVSGRTDRRLRAVRPHPG